MGMEPKASGYRSQHSAYLPSTTPTTTTKTWKKASHPASGHQYTKEANSISTAIKIGQSRIKQNAAQRPPTKELDPSKFTFPDLPEIPTSSAQVSAGKIVVSEKSLTDTKETNSEVTKNGETSIEGGQKRKITGLRKISNLGRDLIRGRTMSFPAPSREINEEEVSEGRARATSLPDTKNKWVLLNVSNLKESVNKFEAKFSNPNVIIPQKEYKLIEKRYNKMKAMCEKGTRQNQHLKAIKAKLDVLKERCVSTDILDKVNAIEQNTNEKINQGIKDFQDKLKEEKFDQNKFNAGRSSNMTQFQGKEYQKAIEGINSVNEEIRALYKKFKDNAITEDKYKAGLSELKEKQNKWKEIINPPQKVKLLTECSAQLNKLLNAVSTTITQTEENLAQEIARKLAEKNVTIQYEMKQAFLSKAYDALSNGNFALANIIYSALKKSVVSSKDKYSQYSSLGDKKMGDSYNKRLTDLGQKLAVGAKIITGKLDSEVKVIPHAMMFSGIIDPMKSALGDGKAVGDNGADHMNSLINAYNSIV